MVETLNEIFLDLFSLIARLIIDFVFLFALIRGLVKTDKDNLLEEANKLYILGKKKVEIGKNEEAKYFLKKALDYKPNDGFIWTAIGEILVQENNYPEAYYCFKNAFESYKNKIEQFPNSKEIEILYLWAGISCMELGNIKKEMKDFIKTKEWYDKSIELFENFREGDYQDIRNGHLLQVYTNYEIVSNLLGENDRAEIFHEKISVLDSILFN